MMKQLRSQLHGAIEACRAAFSDKERYVVEHSLLSPQPPTLATIGSTLKISRERVRQIQMESLRLLRQLLRRRGVSKDQLF
jgi:RNA polymerase nonessential primary-like sigma factor